MRRRFRIVFVPLIVAATMAVVVSATRAGLSGSAHDFSGRSWNVSQDRCIVCHQPCDSSNDGLQPLWQHATTTASFTPYQSCTLDAAVGQPSQASLVCLSCHDGTVAVNSYGGLRGHEYVAGTAQFGTNLRRSHPISFTYDSALAQKDGTLHDPATRTVPSLGGKTIRESLLISDRLECPSCHDVHCLRGESASNEHALVISDQGSRLCLTCHNR